MCSNNPACCVGAGVEVRGSVSQNSLETLNKKILSNSGLRAGGACVCNVTLVELQFSRSSCTEGSEWFLFQNLLLGSSSRGPFSLA